MLSKYIKIKINKAILTTTIPVMLVYKNPLCTLVYLSRNLELYHINIELYFLLVSRKNMRIFDEK